MRKFSFIALSVVVCNMLYAADVSTAPAGTKANLQTIADLVQNKGGYVPFLQNSVGLTDTTGAHWDDATEIKFIPDFSQFGRVDNTPNFSTPTMPLGTGGSFAWRNLAYLGNRLLFDGGDIVQDAEFAVGDNVFFGFRSASPIIDGGEDDYYRSYKNVGFYDAQGKRDLTQTIANAASMRLNKFVTEVAPINAEALTQIDFMNAKTDANVNFFRVGYKDNEGLSLAKVDKNQMSWNATNNKLEIANYNNSVYGSNRTNGVSSSALLKQSIDPSTGSVSYSIVGVLPGTHPSGVTEEWITGNDIVGTNKDLERVFVTLGAGNYTIDAATGATDAIIPLDHTSGASSAMQLVGTAADQFELNGVKFYGSANHATGTGIDMSSGVAGTSYTGIDIREDLGQNVEIDGGGNTGVGITFNKGLDQGAGGLIFKNGKFDVSEVAASDTNGDGVIDMNDANAYYMGAGLDIKEDAEVDWRVQGVSGDYLHKIGKGTLNVLFDDTGVDYQGNLSLGDGVVNLDFTSGTFDNIELVSGRGLLNVTKTKNLSTKIYDPTIFDPTTGMYGAYVDDPDGLVHGLEFGFRGGTVDFQGNSYKFDHLLAADEGARIINTSARPMNLELKPGPWTSGNLADDMRSGSSADIAYHGYIGNNINIKVDNSRGFTNTYVFDGGISTTPWYQPSYTEKQPRKANLSVDGAKVALQGHPWAHAFTGDDLSVAGMAEYPVSKDQADWQRREFNFNNLEIQKSGHLSMLRDSKVRSDNGIKVTGANSEINFGDDGGLFLDLNDGSGIEQLMEYVADPNTPDDHRADYASDKPLDASNADNLVVNMNKAIVTTAIHGKDDTVLNLNGGADWYMPTDSTLGTIAGNKPNNIHFGKKADGTINNSKVTLTTDNLSASNQNFHMRVNPTTGDTDLIKVNNSVTGTNNQVYIEPFGLASSIDGTVKPNTKVVFIDTPAGTSASAFVVPTVDDTTTPFHQYKPSNKVHLGEKDSDGRVKWWFEEPKAAPAPGGGTGTGGIAPAPVAPSVNPFYDAIVDNGYAKQVRSLMSISEAIFLYEDELLMKRMGDIRASKTDGFWFKQKVESNDILGTDLKITEAKFGLDKQNEDNFYGILGEFADGHADAQMGKNEFKYFGIGAYYSYVPQDGWFVDLVAKYILTNQRIKLPTKASFDPFDKTFDEDINMFLGSAELGYRHNYDNGWFIEPSARLTTGFIEGYRIKGHSADAEVDDATPFFGKAGVQFGRNYLLNGVNMSSSIGAHYETNFADDEGRIRLTDEVGSVEYKTFDTDRTVINFSTDAHFSDNVTIYGRVEHSFGSDYEKEIGAQIGLRYQF